MSVRIKIASSPSEIRNLLKVRYEVFVEEEGYIKSGEGVIVDLYDALPTTVNFIALDGMDIIGGVRLTVDSEAGLPSDNFLDFRPILPASARPISCSMLCLRKTYRGRITLYRGMLKMVAYWASANKVTHLCAPVNPLIQHSLERMGFRVVGDQFIDLHGLPTLPMVLDINDLSDVFVEFIRKQNIGVWIENFEREFYNPGDVIIRQGTPGSRAYVLIDGDVALLTEDKKPDKRIKANITRGQIFGELALITDLERSSTVVAKNATELMSIGRKEFQEQLENSPKTALMLLKTVGHRLHQTVHAPL